MKLHQYACNLCRCQIATEIDKDVIPILHCGYTLSPFTQAIHGNAENGEAHICFQCARLVVKACEIYPPEAKP